MSNAWWPGCMARILPCKTLEASLDFDTTLLIAFLLLFDRDANLIALRPSELSDLNAYPARELSKPRPTSRSNGPVLVAGAMFLRFIGRESVQSMRYVPETRMEC